MLPPGQPSAKRRQPLLILLAVMGLLGSVDFAPAAEVDAGAVVMEVKRELDARGVRLILAHLPMRYELYEETTTPYTSPLRSLHPTTIQARRESLRLTLQGVRTIDLREPLLRASTKADIFKENRFHLQESAADSLGAELYRQLSSYNAVGQAGDPREIVFVGDCFAAAFAESARRLNQGDKIRSLIKYAGCGQAHNHLFAFEDEYLSTADVVVWVLGDRNLSGHGIVPLLVNQSSKSIESEIVEARIVQITDVEPEQVDQMPYPNATRATLFERLDTGEHFVAVDYIALDRRLQLSRMFKENYRVQLSLMPLLAFEQANRAAAREVLLDNLEDYESPRYWIQGWLDLRPPDVVQITME